LKKEKSKEKDLEEFIDFNGGNGTFVIPPAMAA